MTRWNIVVSEETDRSLRTLLALNGGKKGDLSIFVEETVRERLRAMQAQYARNAVRKKPSTRTRKARSNALPDRNLKESTLEAFQRYCDEVGARAEKRGMTEEVLNRLLSDER